MDVRELILDRLNCMFRCPTFWASTREAFVKQVMAYLDCAGVDFQQSLRLLRIGKPKNCNEEHLELELDDRYGEEIIEAALKLIELSDAERTNFYAEVA